MSADSPEPDPTLNEKPTNVRWVMFALACGTSWFLYLHRYTWSVVNAMLISDYGFSAADVGYLTSLFTVTYGFGQIPSGILCDFIGPHMFLGLIIVLWSLVLPLFGLPVNKFGIGSFRLMFGAAQSGAYPSLSKVTQVWFPQRSRTIVQGWIATFCGRGGGAMSSIILVTFLMGKCELSWQWSIALMGGVGVLFGATFLYVYRDSPADHPRVNPAELALINEGRSPAEATERRVLRWSRVVKNKTMSFFVVQQIMSAGADVVFLAYIGNYFINVKKVPNVQAGILISLPYWGGAIGGTVGGYLNDWLIHRTGSRRWVRSGIGFAGKAIASGLMFVAIAQDDVNRAAIALFAVKFFSDWSQPTVWGTCTDLGGRFSASIFGVINTAGSLGAVLSPVIFGWILDFNTSVVEVGGKQESLTNYTPLFLVIAAMYIVSACCWWAIDSTTNLDSDLEPLPVDEPVS